MDLITPLLFLAPLLLWKSPAAGLVASGGNKKFTPPPKQPLFTEKARVILEEVEKEIQCPGLKTFLLGAIYVESKFQPSAYRYESGGYSLVTVKDKDGKLKLRSEWVNNPWAKEKIYWQFTGGLTQLFPSSALKTHDKTGYNLNPLLLFDPYYNLAFAIDFAYRLRRLNGYSGYVVNNWLDIRFGWASLVTLKNKNGKRAGEVEGRIVNGINKTGGNTGILYTPNYFDFTKYANEFQFAGILDIILSFKNA